MFSVALLRISFIKIALKLLNFQSFFKEHLVAILRETRLLTSRNIYQKNALMFQKLSGFFIS